jgi:hypothetical protein
MEINAQELTAQFIALPSAQSQELNLSSKPQKFSSHASLDQIIKTEIERLQYLGYLSVKTQEREYLSDPGQRILEISFDLGSRWQNIIFSYPKAIESYVQNIKVDFPEIGPSSEPTNALFQSIAIPVNQEGHINYMMIPVETVPNFLNQLSNAIAQDFSPFSQLKFIELEPLQYPTLLAKLQVNLLPQRKIDSLVIKGYTNLDRGLLKHKAGLRRPMLFEKARINRAEEILSASPYVSVLRPSEALFQEKRTTLYMYLEKKQANQIEGILGFGSDPQQQSLKLNGYLNIQLWNNLDKSEQFDLRYKADGNQQERLEIQAGLPYLGGSPVGVQAKFDLFRRDSTFTTVTSGAQITYEPFGPWSLAMGYTSIRSTTGNEVFSQQSNISDFNQGLLGISFQRLKSRNSVLMPTKSLIRVQGEFGSSDQEITLEGTSLGLRQTNTRQRLNLELDYLLKLWPNHFFWLYQKTALIRGEQLRLNELYRFGGTQSLRGFNENLLETSQMHLIQSEYRLSFSEAFYIHHLTDFAYYRNELEGNMTFNYSVGLGIATVTRAGILKFQIAQGFGKRTDFSTNNTKIHLVFNSRF